MVLIGQKIERGTIAINGYSNHNFFVALANLERVQRMDVSGGYFVNDNWLIGATLNRQSLTPLFDGVYANRDQIFGVGYYSRYYINGKVFTGAGYIYSFCESVTMMEYPFEIGYTALITNSFALETGLNFRVFNARYRTYSNERIEMRGSGLEMKIGLMFFLNRN